MFCTIGKILSLLEINLNMKELRNQLFFPHTNRLDTTDYWEKIVNPSVMSHIVKKPLEKGLFGIFTDVTIFRPLPNTHRRCDWSVLTSGQTYAPSR